MSLSRLFAVILCLSMAGCGFHLQGALTTPPEMQRTYIAAADRHTGFYRELHSALRAAGVTLVDSPNEATASFTVFFDETGQRVLSVSARNVPTEYEVYYIVEYALDSGTENLLERQTLTLTRDYTYDPTLVLGKAKEETLLREAIVRDLVRIVLKQISTL